VHPVLALLSFAENSPVPHDLHVPFSISFWYWPLLHSEQKTSPDAEAVPAPHWPHVLLDVACTAAEALPAGHFVQAASPVASLYLPAAHWVHAPPFAPVNPWLQRQFVDSPLFAGAWEFAGQLSHHTNN
jgi:hypothetical protein